MTMKHKRKRHVCVLLPNKQHLDCVVRAAARGGEVQRCVLEQLAVGDLQLFALAVLRDDEYLFLDLDQKLSKYFGKKWSGGSSMVPFILFLRVQCYVESGLLIMSSKVQQLYYTELRQKVLRSQSRHQETLFFQLAASALQTEIGDLELEANHGQYFLPEDFFPSWLIKCRGRDYLFQNCPLLHAELRGTSQRQAMLQFIREASNLQDGPVTFYRMKQGKKDLRSSVLLGVTMKGVQIYQEVEGKRCAQYIFSWPDIDSFTFQGSRFEITAVGSLCLPKLVYHTHSSFHSKHILRHLRDSHQVHINIREATSYIQELENMQASQTHKEAYICDIAHLRKRLRCSSPTSSMSGCSVTEEAAWSTEKEVEEEDEAEAELWLAESESEEVFVDDPAEVSWLAELLYGTSVDRPLALPSSNWAAVAMEMKQVLWRTADEGVSVD
ncbi:FERM domain-containing protein 6 [Pholidichthys leucotaenia]